MPARVLCWTLNACSLPADSLRDLCSNGSRLHEVFQGLSGQFGSALSLNSLAKSQSESAQYGVLTRHSSSTLTSSKR